MRVSHSAQYPLYSIICTIIVQSRKRRIEEGLPRPIETNVKTVEIHASAASQSAKAVKYIEPSSISQSALLEAKANLTEALEEKNDTHPEGPFSCLRSTKAYNQTMEAMSNAFEEDLKKTPGKKKKMKKTQNPLYFGHPWNEKDPFEWQRPNTLWLTAEEKRARVDANNTGWLFTYTPKKELCLLWIHSQSVQVVQNILQPIAKSLKLKVQPWQLGESGEEKIVTRSSSPGRYYFGQWAKKFCRIAGELKRCGGPEIDGYYAEELALANESTAKAKFHSEVMICNPRKKINRNPPSKVETEMLKDWDDATRLLEKVYKHELEKTTEKML